MKNPSGNILHLFLIKSFKIKLKEEYRFSDVNNLSMLTNSDTEVSKGANLEYKKVSKVNGKSVNYTSDSKISIESPRLIYNYKGGDVNFEVSEVTGKDDTVYFGIFNDQNTKHTYLTCNVFSLRAKWNTGGL